MVLHLLIVNLALLIAYMTAWFLLARKRQRLDTVDSAWGGGFTVAAWAVALQAPSARTLVVALLITVWSGRLTNHIARRSRKNNDDPRYVVMAEKWKGNLWARAYVSLFLTQGFLIWVISLPVVMAANNALSGLTWLTALGAAVWLSGFIIESVADKQLARFVSNKSNKGKVLDTGLWRYSRHPNYFGELTQWWGIGVIALQVAYGWAGLLGPLVLTVLIIFVSGIPPIEKRRQGNEAYQEYKKHTSPLIPLPRKAKA
jgi:steroid 5-alpha reductase family enzyme